VIFSDRLLFLHVPKAGGTSIGHYLIGVLPQAEPYESSHSVGHETLAEARVVLARRGSTLEDFPVVVASIRNPYELEVSRYFWLRGKATRLRRAAARQATHGVQQAIALVGDFELFATYSPPHGMRPLETYFVLDGVVPANLRIVRLENIEAELAECLAAAGVDPGATPIPHLNRSEHDSFTRYYTPAAEHAVYEKYKWVFNSRLYPRLQLADHHATTVDDGGVADRLLSTVLPDLEKRQDDFGLANAWLAAAEIHRQLFRSAAEREALERALGHAQDVGSDRLSARIFMRLLPCLTLGGSHTVDDGIEQCKALLESPIGTRRPAVILLVLAELLAAAGQLEEARAIYKRVMATARTRAPAAMQLLAETAAGSVELLAGDAEAAAALLQHGCPWRPISFVGDHAEALYRIGQYAEAQRLAGFSETTTPAGDVKAQAQWRRSRAKLMARNGESAQACALARAAVRLIERCEAPNLHADTLVDLAEVLRRAGQTKEAISALDEAVRLYDRKGNIVSARAARTLLRDARAAERREELSSLAASVGKEPFG
jgi:tetratricopeptide (TPR) repeat protein